jgi:lipoprotein-anchoring transpeptidase ErfK/SrfK
VLLRHKLDPELHGSSGLTSITRLAAFGLVLGFFGVAAHLATQAWFNGRMLPGVMVAGHDVGGLTMAQARSLVQHQASSYHLSLNVSGAHYELTAAELGVTFDTEATIASAYASGRNSWIPPLHHEPVELAYNLNRSQLNGFASSVATKVGTPPVDAGVVVNSGRVSTVPEKSGWSIDRIGLEQLIEDDVRSPAGANLALQAHEQVADIQVKALTPTIDETKQFMAVPIVLSYNNQIYTPTQAQIGQWITFVKQSDGLAYKLVPQLDMSQLKGYVQALANKLDVAPVNMKVDVINGVSNTVQAGANGTAIDQDPLTAAIAIALGQQAPLTYVITSHPVAFRTVSTNLVSLDLGNYIEINLATQHLWVWQDHAVIYDSPVTTGATGADFGTVTGLFSIYYKTTNTYLNGQQYGPRYNYSDFVKYWMPFYQGYGLHDASWRNGNFGETSGPLGYYYDGSHGCVNLPDATAAFVYNWSVVGTPVWVHI